MSTNPAKAELWKLDANGQAIKKFPVQFNPESLRVSFANQIVPPQNNAAGTPSTDQAQGTPAIQHVGKGTTRLSVQLWFDVTAELPDGLAEDDAQRGDVRELTRKVVDLITPQKDPADESKYLPPAVRFLWGSFQFDGIMEGLDQSLEFFSAEGVPLRTSFTMNLTQQSVDYAFPETRPHGGPQFAAASTPSGAPPGTRPLTPAPAGSTVQGLAAAQGRGGDWQGIALANGIENPRLLAPGQLIDLRASTARVEVGAPSVRLGQG